MILWSGQRLSHGCEQIRKWRFGSKAVSAEPFLSEFHFFERTVFICLVQSSLLHEVFPNTQSSHYNTVLTPDDVQLAIEHGVDGVIISNHGGRQLDGAPATLDALRACAPVAKGRIQIVMDGGIRRGSDIFKALALGAQHCFVGRAAIWGLAVS
jgi:hypothetical protein